MSSSLSAPPNRLTGGTFAAFRHRNYRLWFIGQLVSLVGTWMQNTAQGFLIYTLTGSVAYLGYVGFASGVPAWLLMLYGGVVADRVSRRALMIVTQAMMMILAFVLAALVFLNMVQPWHILVLSLLLGVANAFDTPARQSLVAELVDREDLTNAIALNATMFNTGAIVGPAIGGIIYALTGPGWCFIINGLSFVAVIIALAMMHIPQMAAPKQPSSAMKAILESVQFVRTQPIIIILMLTVFIYNVFGFGLMAIIPAWAVKVLGGDVTTNGALLTARGAGAVLGGLLIASLGSRRIRGKIWAFGSIAIPAILFLFAAVRQMPLALVCMVFMGFGLVSVMNNSNAMVQFYVPDVLRGRVMGLYSLMFTGGGPVGALIVGLAADRIGEVNTAIICAALLSVYATLVWIFRPDVRRMG